MQWWETTAGIEPGRTFVGVRFEYVLSLVLESVYSTGYHLLVLCHTVTELVFLFSSYEVEICGYDRGNVLIGS